MGKVCCKVCNSNQIVNEGEYLICESCGTKYKHDELRKSLSEVVKLDQNHESFFVHEDDSILNKKYKKEKRFHGKQGHGYAAENGNDLIDKILGRDVRIGYGDKNEKHGADRLVDNELIQTKYYADYKQALNKYFPNGKEVVYVDNSSGKPKPMKFEIPPEQYKKAIAYLQDKIDAGIYINGQRVNVRAEDILKKGHVPYFVAKSISTGMNPIAWTYDALSGAILFKDDKGKTIRDSDRTIGSKIPSFWEGIGMAACVTFFQNMIDGRGVADSLKRAICVGLKNGRVQIGSYIVSGELARRGAGKFTKEVKEKISGEIKKYGSKIIGDSAVKRIFKQIEGPLGAGITSCALLTILTRKEISKLIRGKISFCQATKNVAKALVSEAGNLGGKIVGSIAGGAISAGSLALPGEKVGGLIGYGTGKIVNVVLDKLLIDDADKMLTIIENEYYNVSSTYLLSENEHDYGISECLKKIDNSFLEKMFASKDRIEYANRLIKPVIDSILFKRRINQTVSNDEIADTYVNLVEEAVADIQQEEEDFGFFTELKISYKNEFGEDCCPHCGAVLSGYGYAKCFYCLNVVEIAE